MSVGSNKEKVQVPEVLGYPEESAVQVLRDAQFDVTVTYQLTDYQYDGLVINQTPASQHGAHWEQDHPGGGNSG